MSDWETRLDDLRRQLDRRVARVQKLREQGLIELAEREDKASVSERAELAGVLLQMETELNSTKVQSTCASCGGSGWHHYGGYPVPCPACNYDAAVPYSC